jgi:hypothetical protein
MHDMFYIGIHQLVVEFQNSGVELGFSHSAEFKSHLPNAVKSSAMDFNFDLAHDNRPLKITIIFIYAPYMH